MYTLVVSDFGLVIFSDIFHFNISSLPISKYDLLIKLSEAFSLNIDIEKNTDNKSNKVLISKKFTEITGIYPPNWDDLISEFKDDCLKFKSLYKN